MLGDPLLCAAPLHCTSAKCCLFGATSFGVFGDYSLATPYTTLRLNAACFGTTSVGVLGEPLMCYPLHYTQDKCCLF